VKATVLGDVEVAFTTTFTFRWSEENSGAHRDGGFWHPLPPRGFPALGSLGCPSYDDPNGEVVAACVRQAADRPAALADPAGYRWIYDSTGTGSATSGSIWRPVPPRGYAPLGDVCVAGFDKPGPSQVVCTHRPDRAWLPSARSSGIPKAVARSLRAWPRSPPDPGRVRRRPGQSDDRAGQLRHLRTGHAFSAIAGEAQILRLPPLAGPWRHMALPLPALPGADGTQVGPALEINRDSPRADRHSIRWALLSQAW
jgi:hypothetical protein